MILALISDWNIMNMTIIATILLGAERRPPLKFGAAFYVKQSAIIDAL